MMGITCSMCMEDKPIEEFYTAKRYREGRDVYCKVCRNKSTYDTKVQRIMKAFYIYEVNCDECGEDNILLLQFHNKRGKENIDVISSKIVKKGSKLPNYELLCANCHILANVSDGTDYGLERKKLMIEKFTEERLSELDAEFDDSVEIKWKKKEPIRTDDKWNALLRSTIP